MFLSHNLMFYLIFPGLALELLIEKNLISQSISHN